MTDQPTFPGLEVVPTQIVSDAPTASPLLVAAQSTLVELREQGLLRQEHAVLVQLVLELAQVVAAGVKSGRASAVALAARELREALAMLPIPAADVAPENTDWLAFQATTEAQAGAA